MSLDPKKKFFLFKQSKHFCSVPWNHVEIFSDGSVNTCAKGETFGNIKDQPLDSILKNDWVQNLRETLYNDQPHSNCTDCYNLSTGLEHTDLRNHYNPVFKSANIDYSNKEFFNLQGIDLHWGNTCNLKCVYCNPEQSSAIAQEQHVTVDRIPEEHIDKIIDLVVENQYTIKEIYFSGGEPMLLKQNYKLLTRLENLDIPIRINSNITHAISNNQFFNKIKQFRNVTWTISVDSTHERFEYIRFGSNWNEFLKSLDRIKMLGHNLRINSVWFIGSAAVICDTLKFFINGYNINDITINQLSAHPYMLVRNAPQPVKDLARHQLQELLNSDLIDQNSNSYYNIKRCNRELDLEAADTEGYKKYFDQLDSLRGTDWKKIFRELT